jgi:hypothetical protein
LTLRRIHKVISAGTIAIQNMTRQPMSGWLLKSG